MNIYVFICFENLNVLVAQHQRVPIGKFFFLNSTGSEYRLYGLLPRQFHILFLLFSLFSLYANSFYKSFKTSRCFPMAEHYFESTLEGARQ